MMPVPSNHCYGGPPKSMHKLVRGKPPPVNLNSTNLLGPACPEAHLDGQVPVGKGMTVGHGRKATQNSKAEPDALLRAQNEALQDEVQYLRQLLTMAAATTTTDQTQNSPHDMSHPSSSTSCTPASNSKAASDAGGACFVKASGFASASSRASAVGVGSAGHQEGKCGSQHTSCKTSPGKASRLSSVQLRREELLKMKCAQLERQVNILQATLQSRSQVTAEVEMVLSELVHHLTCVAKNAAESTQSIQSAAHLLTFSQQMLSRLQRLKRQTSLSQARDAVPAAAPAAAFCSGSSDGYASCQLPFFTAPGSFVDQATSGMTVIGLCEGQGVLLANPARTQQLESELADLEPRLSSLTVLMRTAVLPAMSLVNPQVAARLQVEVGETAEATAQAAHALTQLAVLLPGQGMLFGKLSAHAAHRQASVTAAGRNSSRWSDSVADSCNQDNSQDAPICHVPSAKQLLGQLPAFGLRDRTAAIKTLSEVLDRLRVRDGMQQCKLQCLEKELHYMRTQQASQTVQLGHATAAASMADADQSMILRRSVHLVELQAEQVGRMFTVASATLNELEPSTAVATVAAADALRQVLEAQAQLNSNRSEASLKQLIAVVRETAPELQQACWLLVSQQEALKAHVATALEGVKLDAINSWCKTHSLPCF